MNIQRKPTAIEKQFKKYHDSLRRELNNAYWHFIIYKNLDKFRGEYQKEMLKAPEFWALTERAHLFDTIMRLNKICDNDKDTVNIHTLLDLAKQNVYIFTDKSHDKHSMYTSEQKLPKIKKQLLSEHQRKYTAFYKTNLKMLRNKVLAHIDKDVVEQDYLPFKGWAVDAEEIEKIINNLDDTLHLLSIAYDGSRYTKEFSYIEQGMHDTMELIRKGLAEREV